jgi:SpoVK/Ycf46/Vps4 family AAA+-type ATPase
MNNAVLFFDECEVVFRTRNQGGDRLLNSLLTEIERHEGVVFLATNRPHELDEAMHRRITAVLEYRPPDHIMRRAIWANLLYGSGGKKVEETSEEIEQVVLEEGNKVRGNPVPPRLRLAEDVDVAALAIKYELTGGFIKNAVLSALLSAISKADKGGKDMGSLSPLVTQEDLISGCKLQMRGSLTQRTFEDKVIPYCGMDELALSPPLRAQAEAVTRFEKARSRVYGSWASQASSAPSSSSHKDASMTNGVSSNDDSCSNGYSSSMIRVSHSNSSSHGSNIITQKACICCLAGPTGSGKKTLMQAMAYDLGRAVKMVHVADLITESTSNTVALLQTMITDARLADAVVAIDGFEHIMEDSGGGEGTWKLHLLLSRMLEVLHRFPGCVVLIIHIDNPQNINLQRDFAVKLFCFLRIPVPPHDIRAKLWSKLMPAGAPLCLEGDRKVRSGNTEDKEEKDKIVNFTELGRRYELNAGSIQAAIARACAEAAMRDGKGAVRQRDLMAAGEAEVSKLKGGNFDLYSKIFT